MKLLPETYKAQKKLSDYCRTGNKVNIKGALESRLPQYRRLVFNIIKNNLGNAYPITKNVVDEDIWNEMVYGFFSRHNCSTPYIWKLPFEFFEFVKENLYSEKYELVFLDDLMFFEWLEIELFTLKDELPEPVSENGSLTDGKAVFNPALRIVHFKYPVHQYAALDAKNKKGDYYLLAHRNPESFDVKFMNISALHVFVIRQMKNMHLSVSEVLPLAQHTFNISDAGVLLRHLNEFLNKLMDEKIILGFSEAVNNSLN